MNEHPKFDRAVANAARMADAASRARLATPVTNDAGKDRLDHRASLPHLDHLTARDLI